jgi:hypothetical protein
MGSVIAVRASFARRCVFPRWRPMSVSCDVNGKLDYTVVAIAQQKSGETRYKIVLQAWRADAATGSFVIIPFTGISCEEPGD